MEPEIPRCTYDDSSSSDGEHKSKNRYDNSHDRALVFDDIKKVILDKHREHYDNVLALPKLLKPINQRLLYKSSRLKLANSVIQQ